MRTLLSSLLLAASACPVAGATKTVTVNVSNPSKQPVVNMPVVVPLGQYGLCVSRAIVTLDGAEVASQVDDTDQDGVADELCFMAKPGPRQTATYTVTLSDEGRQPAYTPHTHAQMLLRNAKVKEKNKHDLLISALTADRGTASLFSLVHQHGPAFENDYGAFRIYFDQRQTVDLYGKQRKGLELRDTQFYPTKEQKAAGYGDDVLWVGNSYGLGALRGWDGQRQTMLDDLDHRSMRVVATGPVRSIVEVKDLGWNTRNAGRKPISATTRYTVWEGRRDCAIDVKFSQTATGYRFATGLVNVSGSTEHSDHKGLRGCWGTAWPRGERDTLNSQRETVGLAICIPSEYVAEELPANDEEYGFVVKADANDELHYHVCFTSANERGFGYKGADDWFGYIKEWKKALENSKAIKTTIK